MKKSLGKAGVIVFSTPIPTKQTLSDPMHINVHPPKYWLALGKKLKFKKLYYKQVSFIPFLYRFNSIFSIGFESKIDFPFVNTTCIYFFEN